jgi:superfamily II DNA or RNA helicase
MKTLDKIRDTVQRDSADAWLKAGGKNSLELSTGIGKTIASLHCAYLVKNEVKTILFLAERIDREKDLKQDLANYNTFFGVNPLKDFKILFSTYQSAYKWKDKHFDLVIADEIHNSLTPAYVAFYRNNTYNYLVGLSATLKDNVNYEDENENQYSKKDLLKELAPICYSYSLSQASQDGASRALKIFVINHRLDPINQTIESGSKIKRFMQTEVGAYNYWDNEFKKSLFIQDEEKKKFRIQYTSRERANLLYKLPSKINAVKTLLNNINEQTLIFGNSLDALLKITPNVISSRNNQKQNVELRESFEASKVKEIASAIKLEQGANLEGLDAVIMLSYYGKSRPLVQRLGRIRKNPDKEFGFVFIFKTLNTVEETKWFPKMMEEFGEGLKTKHEIIYCSDVKDAINKYKNI